MAKIINILSPEKLKEYLRGISLDNLMDAFECVVCQEMPNDTPVYQCERGHILCNVCHAQVTNSVCPYCRGPVGNTRNLVVEKIILLPPRPCKFAEHGCDVELNESTLLAHEESCLYKPGQCPVLSCDDIVPLATLLEHMEENHAACKTAGASMSDNIPVTADDFERDSEHSWPPALLNYNDHYFFLEFLRKENGAWFAWVYLLGVTDDRTAYDYRVTLLSQDTREELSYKGPCVPMCTLKEEINSMFGKCLKFTDETAKHFWENDCILFSVEVFPWEF